MLAEPESGPPMPALFIGHGNPMNAIEDNEFSRAWNAVALRLPKPRAVLCVSAHWESDGSRMTAGGRPRTIHDFSGFPAELGRVQYPAPGSPTLIGEARATAPAQSLAPDLEWGLDHGAWAVLRRMYPAANIPVVQLSLDRRKDPAAHYQLGRELRDLRRRGVLIVGSGNIVHNLRTLRWENSAFDWASEFDQRVRDRILAGDHAALVRYESLGATAALAVPTREHYLPLLYVLAAAGESEPVSFFAEKVTLGSLSMRSVQIGG